MPTIRKKKKLGPGRPRKVRKQIKLLPGVRDEICFRLAQGETLTKICKDKHMPDVSTVIKGVLKREKFREQYIMARMLQREYWADQSIDIADDSTGDYRRPLPKDGKNYKQFNKMHVLRAKLMIETRQWLLERLDGKYTPKTHTTLDSRSHMIIDGQFKHDVTAQVNDMTSQDKALLKDVALEMIKRQYGQENIDMLPEGDKT